MKFIGSLILTAVLSYPAGIFLPWWSIAVVAFLVSLIIPMKPVKAFSCGFLSLFLLWGGLGFFISSNNGNILAQKISQLMIFMNSPVLLIILTGIIAGMVAGFASLSGSFLRYRKEENYNKKLA
ncbi:MAG TPA: hypothetical protein PKA90_02605 [Ignavibacteria bacterium]|nr:hypothetical protein [Ignavibacteria bacterium]